ncbi:type VII secretion target [Nocardia kruczakiae]|uniref:type VII secretion target n=1 Tax=Nocardia kruczakiae TaxID=261477 RepID=UPI0007A46AA1|nr:type VII secretion target [Nocardia kruczakiae]
MGELVAVPEAIRRYGDTAAAMATETLSAGTVNQAVAIAAAVPVFGLIGQDFLATYALAQANHLSSVAELATVHAGTAVTAHQSAATYATTDQDNADLLGGIGRA